MVVDRAKVVGTADIIAGAGPINLLLGPHRGARLASAGALGEPVPSQEERQRRESQAGGERSAFPAARLCLTVCMYSAAHPLSSWRDGGGLFVRSDKRRQEEEQEGKGLAAATTNGETR